MTGEQREEATLQDHHAAFAEIGFLLDIFTTTIDNIMGGATAPVGRIAGRAMANKLPFRLENPSIDEAVGTLAKRMQAGFGFALSGDGDDRHLTFDRCVLRDVCRQRGQQPGGPMCRLFHAYFDGIVNELICRPVKSEISESGEQCLVKIATK